MFPTSWQPAGVLMTITPDDGFGLTETYFHLAGDGDALWIDATGSFWSELMSGEYASEATKRVAVGGWLVSAYRVTRDMTHWEMHPEGDEILYLQSGRLHVILEGQAGERLIELRPGTACLVPRGAWHRQVVQEPADLLAITAGAGTQYRPVDAIDR